MQMQSGDSRWKCVSKDRVVFDAHKINQLQENRLPSLTFINKRSLKGITISLKLIVTMDFFRVFCF